MHESSSSRPLFSILLGAILGLVIGSSCDTSTAVPGAGDVAAAAAGCPDTSSVNAIAKGDWSGTFGIDAKTANKIKAGLEASLELKGFAGKLDADLKGAVGSRRISARAATSAAAPTRARPRSRRSARPRRRSAPA